MGRANITEEKAGIGKESPLFCSIAGKGRAIPESLSGKRLNNKGILNHKELSDEELVRSFVEAKDEEAFDELVNRYDVSVEEAELKALQAQAALAETTLARMQRLTQSRAASQEELDRARAERDVARAQIARIRAIIAKKTIRAPFRARVGLADVHPGQYLNEGTQLTTLQGIDDAVHVDFAVPQWVAVGLSEGDSVDVFATSDSSSTIAKIVAIDARIDPTTRNAMVRVRIEGAYAPAPGSSVRVRVPVGQSSKVVAVPVSALRKGPDGDHVFVLTPDGKGMTRAHVRRVRSASVIDDEVLILAGLSPGERVATSGSFKLREAALVTIASDPRTDSRTER